MSGKEEHEEFADYAQHIQLHVWVYRHNKEDCILYEGNSLEVNGI